MVRKLTIEQYRGMLLVEFHLEDLGDEVYRIVFFKSMNSSSCSLPIRMLRYRQTTEVDFADCSTWRIMPCNLPRPRSSNCA